MIQESLRKILTNVQKPGRYTGGEPGCIYKDEKDVSLRFAFCFPDTYEVGMSFLGMKILYELLNKMDGVWCERAFMPWVDMLAEMQKNDTPLYALESKSALSDFDILGFTLQYELSYTNVLAMLRLSGVPLRAQHRDESHPIVLAGGPCTCNAEPMAAFFDVILLGEGEEQLPEVCKTVQDAKAQGLSKAQTLKLLAKIQGVYLPAFYEIEYAQNGTVASIKAQDDAPLPVKKAVLKDFDTFAPPENFVVPMVGAVHDRAQIEVLRGCVRGCRFCQAGFIYRPMRQRAPQLLNDAARRLCDNTGYEELSLTSLSTSDYGELEPLMDKMLSWTGEKHINLAMPSLRVDNFTESLAEKITRVRKSGLTFAPEAGTQRLRDVINKNVTEEEIERTVRLAFEVGYSTVKLYFMIGLPTETLEDIEGIAAVAQRVVDIYYDTPKRHKGKSIKVNVSVACFVPKPMTPFQYCPQDAAEVLAQKQKHLLSCVRNKKISVSWHDARVSFMEAAFARADRRFADVIEAAFEAGCVFDGWDEHFKYETWLKAFEQKGIHPHEYAQRSFEVGDAMPWGHLDYGVSEKFLASEYKKATSSKTTQPCNKSCAGCGAQVYAKGGECFANC